MDVNAPASGPGPDPPMTFHLEHNFKIRDGSQPCRVNRMVWGCGSKDYQSYPGGKRTINDQEVPCSSIATRCMHPKRISRIIHGARLFVVIMPCQILPMVGKDMGNRKRFLLFPIRPFCASHPHTQAKKSVSQPGATTREESRRNTLWDFVSVSL